MPSLAYFLIERCSAVGPTRLGLTFRMQINLKMLQLFPFIYDRHGENK